MLKFHVYGQHFLNQERLNVKQEAQLPQRNSAAAAHMYLGWLSDLLMITLGISVHRTRQNRRGRITFLHLKALIQKVRAENGF